MKSECILQTVLCAVVFIASSARGDPICVADPFNIALQEDIDMFENYTDRVTFHMECSQPRFPTLRVEVEPKLQEELAARQSQNGKVAFSIRCSLGNDIQYWNSSYSIKKKWPWYTEYPTPERQLQLGQNCSVIGCYYDLYVTDDNLRRSRGFAVEGSSCITNTNECEAEVSPCEQGCRDTVESYDCYCYSGYRLDNDSHNCTDVDECSEGTHKCNQNCHNTEGGYSCSCLPGYYSALDDNTTCIDINECSNGAHRCDHECLNTNGSYSCTCRDGYLLAEDRHSCTDVDECDPDSGVNIRCHRCNNTDGSFMCTCLPHHTLSSDKHRCLAPGECEMPQVCSQECVNTTEGDYYCQCHSGFVLTVDGHNCTAKQSLGDSLLVVYMPWAVPLAVASLLLLFSITLYYSISRRRKHGHILETNHDLYEFYLTQEKIDCTYEPVDLSNGLSFDAESLHSNVTAFHTPSNTVENLAKFATLDETQILVVTGESQSSTEENNKDSKEEEGNGGEEKEVVTTEVKDPVDQSELGTGFGMDFDLSRKMSGDSCIGSSIAGDSSSGIHSSSLLCTPDTSDSSFLNSASDTSANTDYIATDCQDSSSSKNPFLSKLSMVDTPALSHTPDTFETPRNKNEEENVSSHDAESQSVPAESTKSNPQAKNKKTFPKTKDYIHATNALFGVVDHVTTNSQ